MEANSFQLTRITKKVFIFVIVFLVCSAVSLPAFGATNLSEIVGDNNFIPASKTAPYKVAVNVSLPDGSEYNFINRYYTYSNQLLLMIQPASADTFLGTLSFTLDDLDPRHSPYVRIAVPTAVRSGNDISYLDDVSFYIDVIPSIDIAGFTLPDGVVVQPYSILTGRSYLGVVFNAVQNSSSNNYLGIYFSSIKSFAGSYFANDEFYRLGDPQKYYLLMQYLAYCYNHNLQNTAFDGRILFQTYSSEGFAELNTDEFKLLKKVLADNNKEVIQSIDELEISIVRSFDSLIDMGDSRYTDFSSAMSAEHSQIVSDVGVIDSYVPPSSRDFAGISTHFSEALSVIGQDTALTAAFRGAISSALGNNLVMTILLAGAFLSVAGYLLFGKRG